MIEARIKHVGGAGGRDEGACGIKTKPEIIRDQEMLIPLPPAVS